MIDSGQLNQLTFCYLFFLMTVLGLRESIVAFDIWALFLLVGKKLL